MGIMARVALQTGIRHEADTRLRFQPLGDFHGVFVMLPHPQGKGHRAAHDEPRIEGADRSAQIHLGYGTDQIKMLCASYDSAPRNRHVH